MPAPRPPVRKDCLCLLAVVPPGKPFIWLASPDGGGRKTGGMKDGPLRKGLLEEPGASSEVPGFFMIPILPMTPISEE